jgi:hypothetical protein
MKLLPYKSTLVMIQNYNPRPMTAEEIKALEIKSYGKIEFDYLNK